MEPKTSRFLDNYHARRAKDARRNIWVITFLFFLLLVGACSFLTISGHGATFRIGQEEQPVNIIEVSPGVWRAMLLNATATIDASATLTVEQNDSLAAWQQTAGLFFYRNEGGAYTLLKIAEANAVTPVVSGNTIIWPALWTLPGGAADYEITVTDQRILKTVRFNGAAGAVLPSPTSAEFFPGAPESELGFAIGSDPFPGERAEGVTGEMDGVPIDLDDDQVVGVSMTMKWNGAFLHKFLPAYAGMHQGIQIYLGDLQMHFAAWSWADAKDEAEFDPSYSFQASSYIVDGHLHSIYNYYPEIVIGIDGADDTDWGIIDIDAPALAAAYNIAPTSAGVSTITAFSLKLIPNGDTAGSPTNIYVRYDPTPAADTTALTWATRDAAPLPIHTWNATGITLNVTQTISDAAFLLKLQACIVSGIKLQLYFIPSWGAPGAVLAGLANEENADIHLRPIMEMTLLVPALAYPGSTFYLPSPHVNAASLTISASMGNNNMPQSSIVVLYASGWMENPLDRVQISNLTNAVSSADATISGASPIYSWYIEQVTYSNISVSLNDGMIAPVIYYASNSLDVWTPDSTNPPIHQGSVAQIMASTYSLMGGGWMKYIIYDGANKIQAGTSSTTQNIDPASAVILVNIPAAQQDHGFHLGIENHQNPSIVRYMYPLEYGGGGGGSSTDYSGDFLRTAERISAATAFVSTASSSLTTAIAANNTAIVQNNVILHEVDNRTRLTQSDVLAAGGIVPTSGMLVTKTSLNVLGDPYRQLYITGPSLNPATPSIAIKLFQGLTTDIDSYPGGTILYASGSLAAFTSVVGSTVYIHSFYRDLPTVADFYRADVVVHDGTNPIFSQLTWSKSATPSLDTSDLLTQSNFNDWAAGNESVVFALSAGLVDLVTVYYADAEIDATTLAWATGKTGFYVPAGAVYGSNVEWDGRYGRNYGSILWNYLSTVSGRAQPLILSGTDVASVTPVQTQATAWGHAVSTK